MTHRITKQVIQGRPELHTAHCKSPCNWHAGKHEHEWQVDDEWTAHLADIERIKAHLGSRTPSLASQADYYREREQNDPNVAARPEWKRLADEVDIRLGRKATKWADQQLPLP